VQLLVFAYVAPLVGLLGYHEAATFEREHRRRVWRLSPSVWGIACLVSGPVAVCFLLIGVKTTRRHVRVSLRSTGPSRTYAPPRHELAPPLVMPKPPPRPLVPRSLPATSPRLQQHWTAQPQAHPADAQKVYLFGPPVPLPAAGSASGWGAPDPAPVVANVGGTDLLPHGPQRGAPRLGMAGRHLTRRRG